MSTLADLLGHDNAAWMADGLCADSLYPDRWFPTEVHETQARAELLCGGCPVRVACLKYAVDDPTLEGIYGGTTTNQRRQIRRWANASHGTYGGYLRHNKNGETPCDDCRAANAAQSRKKRRKNNVA